MQAAYGCQIRETYGQAEKICAASECEYGTLHTWPEVGYIEIQNEEGGNSRAGEPGHLISTSLIGDAMPLIRYDTSDMVTVPVSQMDCQCGRGLPIISRVDGRYNDAIVTREGRYVGQVDAIFRGDLRIREAQIIQETIDRFIIQVIPVDDWTVEDDKLITKYLQERVGKVDVLIRLVSEIERTWSGKFRAVISKVDQNNLTEETTR